MIVDSMYPIILEGINLKICKCKKIFWQNTELEYCSSKCSEIIESKKEYNKRMKINCQFLPIRPLINKKPIRKNASKRIHLPRLLKEAVYKRSQSYCEEKNCINKAIAIHHKLSVSRYPNSQHLLANLIHLCLKCHRLRHPNLPDILFKP